MLAYMHTPTSLGEQAAHLAQHGHADDGGAPLGASAAEVERTQLAHPTHLTHAATEAEAAARAAASAQQAHGAAVGLAHDTLRFARWAGAGEPPAAHCDCRPRNDPHP